MTDSDTSPPADLAAREIRREDYRPPAFLVDTVDLRFELDPASTLVRSRLALRRNPAAAPGQPLRLDGEALTLLSVQLGGEVLGPNRYMIGRDGALTLDEVPDAFTLEIATRINPSANSELSGLYVSGGSFFTQCEAEGFRRITFFPDRPDVMARFTTTLVADRAACPVLLSNGNPEGAGDAGEGRHFATWADPHPKPAYLFALVAGSLVCVRDRFTTRSGREVALGIWVRAGDEDRCGHAMRSLKTAMRWDEEVYGLEYDLDVFNIAAVSDFNMGAMENKGLNVFNTKYVLARPDTATDTDYLGIESVVAHEYFHNWTGNRVTCRDWFQLSLKEGLTVFRDQEFSADQGSRAVKRIADVRALRGGQFPEDAGPLAHPVRPESYVAIDNFYTATVYQKGAEVVRMIQTIIGRGAFRKGMDLYIARHDNSAVTIEDFVQAMEDASGVSLADFRRWYAQAGTPELTAGEAWDAASGTYTLTLRQSTPPTPGQSDKQPLPIPVAMALLDGEGREMVAERVLMLRAAEADFTFPGLAARPVPSLLRGFSAPVKLLGVPAERLRFLAAHDSDPFVRWDSLQQYATEAMLTAVAASHSGTTPALPENLSGAIRATLDGADADPAFAADLLALPSEAAVANQMTVADPDGIHAVREALRCEIGRVHAGRLRAIYDRLADTDADDLGGVAMGRRSLRIACLSLLAAGSEDGIALASARFGAGGNMTEVLGALSILAATDTPARVQALASFHARWRHDALVLDKWFAIQAGSSRPDALAAVQALYRHPDFDLHNPNRARSLVGTFAINQARFHGADGGGYRFLADAVIAMDSFNGQTAARLISSLGQWRRQNLRRQALMRAELERILAAPGLSRFTWERATKALA
jgi:aminopeptidase N